MIYNVIRLIEVAASNEEDGYVNRALGRKASVIFKLLLKSTVPDSSAFLAWLGLGLSSALHAPEGSTQSILLAVTVAVLLVAGVLGMLENLKTAAARSGQEGRRINSG